MQLNGLPQSSLALEPAIDYHPLTVAPDTPLVDILVLMSQLQSSCELSCELPNWNSQELRHESFNSEQNNPLKSTGVVGNCVLVTEGRQLLGVFTVRDIVKLTADQTPLNHIKIADVLTQLPITLRYSEAQDIFTALGLFRQHRIRHLPIVDDGNQLMGIVTHDSIRRALQPVTLLTRLRYVADVMTTQVVHASMTASVLELAQLMTKKCVSCVVITQEAEEQRSPKVEELITHHPSRIPPSLIPVGIVTERDIVQFRALELDLSKMQAQDVMSTPLFCLRPSDSLWVAHQEMQQRRVRRLVVTGYHGEMLGIVSQTSLLQVLNPADMYSVIEVLQQAVEERTKELQTSNKQLRHEITERKRAEAALQQAHDDLKRQVEERTAELAQANARLQKDILERIAAEVALRQSEAQLRKQTTQLEQALHQLQKAQTQLIQTEKMSSLGQLVASVAHEINNPINFIYGNLTYAGQYVQDLLNLLQLYIKHYPQPEPEIQAQTEVVDLDFLKTDLPKLLGSMKVGADRIRDLVLSLRNFSRLDEAEMKTVNIHQGLDSTLLILENQLKARVGRTEIQIVKEYGTLPLVECHAGQLNQVFMNIISNAIDALDKKRSITAEDQGKLEDGKILIQNSLADSPRVALHTRTASGVVSEELVQSKISSPQIRICTEVINHHQVAIRIIDNGSGIPEAVRRQMFNPFFTTKPVGQGTGLGLSISYQIVVEKHRGQLKCISAPEEGSEFIIEIPIRQSKHSVGLATA